MTTYSIFKKEEKYGLHYLFNNTQKVVLEPTYTYLRILDEDLDLKALITAEAWEKIDGFLIGVGEHTNYAIVEADGKQGLISWGETLIELQYERIIKLSWRHYLCKKGVTYVLYDHFGYDQDKYPITIELLATVTLQGTITLPGLINAFLEVCPKAHTELKKCLHRDLENDVYISQYRRWEGRVGYHSIFATAATQKVLIHDDFEVVLLKIEF